MKQQAETDGNPGLGLAVLPQELIEHRKHSTSGCIARP